MRQYTTSIEISSSKINQKELFGYKISVQSNSGYFFLKSVSPCLKSNAIAFNTAARLMYEKILEIKE